MRHDLLWKHVLYLTTFGLVDQKHPPTLILTLGKARIILNITQIGFF